MGSHRLHGVRMDFVVVQHVDHLGLLHYRIFAVVLLVSYIPVNWWLTYLEWSRLRRLHSRIASSLLIRLRPGGRVLLLFGYLVSVCYLARKAGSSLQGFFDSPIVGISGNAKNLVVILLFRHLQQFLCATESVSNLAISERSCEINRDLHPD